MPSCGRDAQLNGVWGCGAATAAHRTCTSVAHCASPLGRKNACMFLFNFIAPRRHGGGHAGAVLGRTEAADQGHHGVLHGGERQGVCRWGAAASSVPLRPGPAPTPPSAPSSVWAPNMRHQRVCGRQHPRVHAPPSCAAILHCAAAAQNRKEARAVSDTIVSCVINTLRHVSCAAGVLAGLACTDERRGAWPQIHAPQSRAAGAHCRRCRQPTRRPCC